MSPLKILAPLVVLAALGAPALAEGNSARCTVTEIHASNKKEGVDPRLDRLKPKLTKPPFASWDTFKLLGEQVVTAERQKPVSAKLVNGNLTLLLKEATVAQAGKLRLHLAVDVDNKEGKRIISSTYNQDSNDPLFISGIKYEDGMYVLALTCAAQ